MARPYCMARKAIAINMVGTRHVASASGLGRCRRAGLPAARMVEHEDWKALPPISAISMAVGCVILFEGEAYIS